MGRIFGRCALVTGAASGIGRATARLFALEGATVIVTDINVEGGRAVAEEIGSRAAQAKVMRFAATRSIRELS